MKPWILLTLLSFFLLGCASKASIKHESVYFVKNTDLHHVDTGPYIFHEFYIDRLLTYSVVKGNPQARLYIPPEPRGEVYGISGRLYLIDNEVCLELKEEICFIKHSDKRLDKLKTSKNYYKYLAVYTTIHQIDHNSTKGALNLLEDYYDYIQLNILAYGKPFKSMESEPYELKRDEIMKLWKSSLKNQVYTNSR